MTASDGFWFLCWALWVALGGRGWAADAYQGAAELRAQYAADIERLAQWCDSCGLSEQAGQTRAAVTPQEPNKIFMPVLPVEIGPPETARRLAATARQLGQAVVGPSQEHATKLYQMARQQVRTGRESLAFGLMLDAIQANPDYAPVRQMLGYQKFRNEWRTAYELKKLHAGMVFSDKFGWMSKKNLGKFEAGQRLARPLDFGRRGRPGPPRHQNRLGHRHGALPDPYRPQHRGGHRPERETGKPLPPLAGDFLPFYASEADVVALFEGKGKRAPAPAARHKIDYFRDRADYVETLKGGFPQIAMTAGVYVGNSKTAYFYADPKKNDDRTLYHEATHQLFNESRKVVAGPGERGNFWIVEGIAMLMESLHQEGDYWVIGGFQDERMRAAQVRLPARQVLRPAG